MIGWYTVGEFFLSQWIWSVTYGLYQVPISMVIMFIITRWVARIPLLHCLALSIVSHVISTVLFHFGIIGILITFLNFTYQHPYASQTTALPPFYATLSLGLIHTFIQSILFFIIGFWYGYQLSIRMTIVSFLSNVASAFITLLFLPQM